VGDEEWILNMEILKSYAFLSDKEEAQKTFRKIKRENKEKLAEYIKKVCNVNVNINSLFVVQIKKMHEYKRQFMNILYVIHRYLLILKTPEN